MSARAASSNSPLRLKLTTPSPDDDANVAKLLSHPETRRYLLFLPETCTTEEAKARRETRTADARTFDFDIHWHNTEVGQVGRSSSFVGVCGLSDINTVNQSAEGGILILPSLHRTGLGTEAIYALLNYAFNYANLHRIVFETGTDNVQMRGWFEKLLKIQPEYRLKESWKAGEGKWVDSVGYRILDYEWRGGLQQLVEYKIQHVAALQ